MSDWRRPAPPDRDPALDAAWKAHSTELPPPRLDAAILAAAHREARTRPQALGDDDAVAHARRPSRAWWGLAAAATIGAIAFGVLQLAPPPPADPSATVATDVPRAAPEPAPPVAALRDAPPQPAGMQRPPSEEARPPADALTASREKDRVAAMARAPESSPSVDARANTKPAESKQRRADATARQRESAFESPTPPARALAEAPAAAVPRPASPEPGVKSPTPFPEATPAPSIAAAAPTSPPAPASTPPAELAKSEAAANAVDARRREAGERRAAAAPAQSAAQEGRTQADRAGAAATAPVAKLQVRTPAAWIEQIRTLHAEQRFDEAARELNRFREAYPDADTRLPLALQSWAASVKRN
jgi:hypothetical protein